MNTIIENRIKNIIAKILLINPSEINDDTSFGSVDSWNSINHKKIINALEREFDISFDKYEKETFFNYKIIKITISAYIC